MVVLCHRGLYIASGYIRVFCYRHTHRSCLTALAAGELLYNDKRT